MCCTLAVGIKCAHCGVLYRLIITLWIFFGLAWLAGVLRIMQERLERLAAKLLPSGSMTTENTSDEVGLCVFAAASTHINTSLLPHSSVRHTDQLRRQSLRRSWASSLELSAPDGPQTVGRIVQTF